MGIVEKLFEMYPTCYHKELGIDLKGKKPKEVFKWFLASILFAKPIRDITAMKTYRVFESAGVTTAKKILETGWHGLVDLLDAGGYTRYDFSTADKLLEMAKNLQKKYDGSLVKLYESCRTETELREKIKALGKGIGDGTVDIFFRELRGVWRVNPEYSRFTVLAAKNLGIRDLKGFWKKNRIRGKSFVDFETALLRLGKDYCRKGKCGKCPLNKACKKFKK